MNFFFFLIYGVVFRISVCVSVDCRLSKMPGVQQQQSDGAAVGVGSPLRKKRLSLKFLQRKETKRALDFTEPQAEEVNTAVPAATTRWEDS